MKKFLLLISALISLVSIGDGTVVFHELKDKLAVLDTSQGYKCAAIVKFRDGLYVVTTQSAVWGAQKFKISSFSGDDIPFSAIEVPVDRRGLLRLKIDSASTFFNIKAANAPTDSKGGTICSIEKESGILFLHSGSLDGSSNVSLNVRNPDFREPAKPKPSAVDQGQVQAAGQANVSSLDDYREFGTWELDDLACSPVIANGNRLAGFIDDTGISCGQFIYFEIDDSIQWTALKQQEFVEQGKFIEETRDFIPRYLIVVNSFFKAKYKTMELTAGMPKEMTAWISSYNEHIKDIPFTDLNKVKKGASLEGVGGGSLTVQNKRMELEKRLSGFAVTRMRSAENLKDGATEFIQNEAKKLAEELRQIVTSIEKDSNPNNIVTSYQPTKKEIKVSASALKPIIDDGKPKLGKIRVSGRDYAAKANQEAWRIKGRILAIGKKDSPKFKATLMSAEKKEIKSDEAKKQKDGTNASELWLEPGKYTIVITSRGYESAEIGGLEVKTDNDLKVNLDFIKPE